MASYQVFNATDGVYAAPKAFKTLKAATEFIKELRARYERQGYYSSCAGRIPIADLKLEIERRG